MAIGKQDIERLQRRFSKLESKAATHRAHVQECMEFAKPRKANVTSKGTEGEKKHQRVTNSHPEHCVDVYANGLGHGITPASTDIARLVIPGEGEYDADAREWTDYVMADLHKALEASNFQDVSHECYVGSATDGFCLHVEEGPRPGDIVCREIPLAEYVIAEDSKGTVDTVMRKFEMSARQIAQEWPDHGSDKVNEALADDEGGDPDKEFTVYHAVYPRSERDTMRRDQQNRPWAGVYWLDGDDDGDPLVLEEGGHWEMPYIVVRTSRGIGAWGRGPLMKALADIKTLQAQERTNMRSAEKRADPALAAPFEGMVGPIKGNPRTINYYDPNKLAGYKGPALFELPGGGDPSFSLEMQDRKEQAIERALLVDVFKAMPRSPDMRVDQVLEIKAEAMRQLGPFLGRLQNEYLGPLFKRVFGIRWRAGKLPPLPESLRQAALDFEFISPLFRGYRLADEIEGIGQAFAFADSRFQMTQDQSVYDNLDVDEALRTIGERYQVPAKVLRDSRRVQEIREARAQAQAQAAQAQQQREDLALVADAAGKMGKGGQEVARATA